MEWLGNISIAWLGLGEVWFQPLWMTLKGSDFSRRRSLCGENSKRPRIRHRTWRCEIDCSNLMIKQLKVEVVFLWMSKEVCFLGWTLLLVSAVKIVEVTERIWILHKRLVDEHCQGLKEGLTQFWKFFVGRMLYQAASMLQINCSWKEESWCDKKLRVDLSCFEILQQSSFETYHPDQSAINIKARPFTSKI